MMKEQTTLQEKNEKKEEPLFLITLTLAQRIMRYIQASPSPNFPVGEAMDIVNSISKLPQATVKKEEKNE